MKTRFKVLIAVAAMALVVACGALYVNGAYNIHHVPSESMQPTLQVDDMIMSKKGAYDSAEPQVGDIITFWGVDFKTGDHSLLVKRIVAVGGQTVDLRDGKVYVDGVESHMDCTVGQSNEIENSLVTFPYAVPEGYVWAMGDNREDSLDSRAFGAIPLGNITGKVTAICWPLWRIGAVG